MHPLAVPPLAPPLTHCVPHLAGDGAAHGGVLSQHAAAGGWVVVQATGADDNKGHLVLVGLQSEGCTVLWGELAAHNQNFQHALRPAVVQLPTVQHHRLSMACHQCSCRANSSPTSQHVLASAINHIPCKQSMNQLPGLLNNTMVWMAIDLASSLLMPEVHNAMAKPCARHIATSSSPLCTSHIRHDPMVSQPTPHPAPI